MTKKYLVRPSKVISKNDSEVHHISAADLIRLHGVDPRECIVIKEGEDWPLGLGPMTTEAEREAAGLKLLTPDFEGRYDREHL